jgi:hypothetical protein
MDMSTSNTSNNVKRGRGRPRGSGKSKSPAKKSPAKKISKRSPAKKASPKRMPAKKKSPQKVSPKRSPSKAKSPRKSPRKSNKKSPVKPVRPKTLRLPAKRATSPPAPPKPLPDHGGRGSATKGWKKNAPRRGREREAMNPKCFLMPNEHKFPVCAAGTNKMDCHAIVAAKARATQHGYSDVAVKAEKLNQKYKCTMRSRNEGKSSNKKSPRASPKRSPKKK